MLLGIAMIPAGSANPAFILRRDAHVVWVSLSNGLLFALLGSRAYLSSVDRRVRARVSREIAKIDLLGRRSLAPLARIRERIRLAKESTLEMSGGVGEAAAQLPGLLALESGPG